MYRIALAPCLLAVAVGLVKAQTPPTRAASKGATELKKIANEGEPIVVESNVSRYVSIQAVLLPPSVSRRVFGKEITNNYAAIGHCQLERLGTM